MWEQLAKHKESLEMGKIKEWTAEERQKLRDLYRDHRLTIEEICAKFPDRTDNAIRLKASRLGIHRPLLGDLSGIPETCPVCGHRILEGGKPR